MTRKLILLAAAALLGGCKVLVPFEQEFSCTADRDYGKCTTVEGAYSEALGGQIAGEVHYVGEDDVAKHQKKKNKKKRNGEDEGVEDSGDARAFTRYKQAEYDELAKLIEAPITPMVKQPDVLRTLVIAYGSGGDNIKTLYMPRYIFYFASDAGFVLGDYLSGDTRGNDPMLYPQAVGTPE